LKYDAIAQLQPQPVFKHLTTEQGLPSSEVYHSIQDSKGYIWFATNMGVCRYDGFNFRSFTTSDGLPDNTIFELFEDYKGRIWFVSFSCNLSYFENDSIHLFKYNTVLQKALKTSSVKTAFYVDKNDNVYLSVTLGGYFIITPQGKITSVNLLGKNKRLDLIQFDSTIVFPVFYLNKPFLREDSVEIQTNGCRHSMLYVKGFPFFGLLKSIKRKNGTILLANGYLTEIKKEPNCFIDTTINAISIAEDSDEDIWAGTRNGVRLYKKQLNSGISFNYLQGLSVSSTLQDKEGGLWFTTLEEGIYYLPSKEFLSYTKQNHLTANKITCITSDNKETVYAGMSDGSFFSITNNVLHEIHFSENKIKHDLSARHNYFFAMRYDSCLSSLWVGLGRSVGFFYPHSKNSDNKLTGIVYGKTKLSGGFNHFARGKNDIMYADSWGTIWKIKKDTALSIITKEQKRIIAIYEDSHGKMLIGSLDGLWVLKNDGKYIPFDSTKALLKNRIEFITETKDHILCLATRGAGVLFVNGARILQISTKDGLTSDNVEHILIDKNELWLSTNKGVNRINFLDWKNFKYSIMSYTQTDGLVSDEVCEVLKLNKNIWVATNKGLTVFNPDNVKTNKNPPPIYITGVRISAEDRKLQEKYSDLGYDQNSITIRYIGLSFRSQGKIKYRYKLTPINKTWNYTDLSEIQFAGLEYGYYTFLVSAQSKSGVWSSKPAIVSFNILPPLWKTWWFRGAIVICIIALIIYIIYFKNKKAKARFEIERTIIELKGNALRAQMNPHFIFNSLNSIQSYILSNNKEQTSRYLTSFSRLIRLILENSKKSEVSINEEVSALKHYLDLEKMRFKDLFNYSITVDKAIDKDSFLIPPMLIQPYVENAIIHGIAHKGKEGEIKIDFEIRGELIRCTIADNGIGKAAAQLLKSDKEAYHSSVGTEITAERLVRLNGDLKSKIKVNIKDMENEQRNLNGTQVEIFIPYSNIHNNLK
jgi:ligand-binding sensor domain-containing protein